MKPDSHKDKIPGFIEASLINIVEFDQGLLSKSGLILAKAYQKAKDTEEQDLKQQAKQLDDMFEVLK